MTNSGVGSATAAYVGGLVADARGDQLGSPHSYRGRKHEQSTAIHPDTKSLLIAVWSLNGPGSRLGLAGFAEQTLRSVCRRARRDHGKGRAISALP